MKKKIRTSAESISLDSTPEQIHSASTSITEAIEELSVVALRRIESQQQGWQQNVDSLIPFASAAPAPVPEAKPSVQVPATPAGPATSPISQPTAPNPVAPQRAIQPSVPKSSPEPTPERAAQAATTAPESPADSAPAPTTAEIQPRSLFPSALNEARQAPGCFLAVLPIERFTIYHSRFGPQAAKDIFDYFAQYLRRRLRPTDRIFCWADGVVLAIITRTVSIDSVRAEFMRLGLQKVEQTVTLGGGSSFHPVS